MVLEVKENLSVSPTQTKIMSKPHKAGTNGQFNDEYDQNVFEKMRKKHYIPRKVNYDNLTNGDAGRINIANLPESCDDEMFDDYILTTRDLSTVRNAAHNALQALTSYDCVNDEEADITEENCLRVSTILYCILLCYIYLRALYDMIWLP